LGGSLHGVSCCIASAYSSGAVVSARVRMRADSGVRIESATVARRGVPEKMQKARNNDNRGDVPLTNMATHWIHCGCRDGTLLPRRGACWSWTGGAAPPPAKTRFRPRSAPWWRSRSNPARDRPACSSQGSCRTARTASPRGYTTKIKDEHTH